MSRNLGTRPTAAKAGGGESHRDPAPLLSHRHRTPGGHGAAGDRGEAVTAERPTLFDHAEPAPESQLVTLDARAVKDKLYGRHPGSGGQMPGPWTCIEEWRNIDFLAFGAWSSATKYDRIGYEVKVSRSDLRSELLNPGKRAQNVEWCNEFYLGVPSSLLTAEEIAYEEPEWQPEDWRGERCPGFAGETCYPLRYRSKTHQIRVPRPTTEKWLSYEYIACPTCGGKGVLTKSRVETEAPTCWVPRDLGLVVVDGRGTRVVKKSPRRKEVPTLDAAELGTLVRWVSMRPDPRHEARRASRRIEVAA